MTQGTSGGAVRPGRFMGWLHRLFDSDMFQLRDIVHIFFPLLLDQFFIQFISMVSTALVSSIGQEAMAAVNMVGTISYLVTAIFYSIGMGGGVIIAQAKGHGDKEQLHRAVGQTTTLCFCTALVTSVVLFIGAEPLVKAIYPRAEPKLTEYAVEYLRLSTLSMIPYSIFHAIFTAFRSVGDSRSSLVLTVFINVAHLLLSILFINVCKLGVAGSGLSYIVARVFGLVAAIVWLAGRRDDMHLQMKHFTHLSRDIVLPEVRLAIPFAVEQMLFHGGMLFVQRYLSMWGDTPAMATMAIAANAVANSCFTLAYSTLNAVTAITSTVCGQCIGAGKIDLCKRYCRSMVKAGRLVGLVTAAVMLPLSPLLLKMHNPNPDAVGMIYQMLLVALLPLPLWSDAFVTPTMLRSAGDANYTTVISLTGMFFGRMVLGYFLTIVLNMGPLGIWLSQLFEWLYRIVFMEHRFRSDKWQKYIRQPDEPETAQG